MTAMNRQDFIAAEEARRRKLPGRFARKDAGGADAAELAKELKDLGKSLKDRDAAIKASMESMKEELKGTGELSTETKAALEKQAEDATAVAARLQEIEQKLAATNEDRKQERLESIGRQFVGTDEYKAWAEKPTTPKYRQQFKAITSLTSGTGGAGDLVQEQRVPGIIATPNRVLTVRDLISAGRTVSNTIEYILETGFINAAAMVAEGNPKPESSLSFDLETAPVRTLAHWMDASKQILDDAPMLASYIDTRLRFGLQIVEEDQILAGDGTGQNLHGLIPQATDFQTSRAQPGDTRIDIIRRAMTQVRLAEYRASAIMLHPEDWEEIELTKTTEGAYVWGNPATLLNPTIWGLPVIESTALSSGEFLIGNFMMAAQIWDRELSNVEVSTETGDNFKTNMVTIRAEERLALTVYRPEAIVFGDFADVVSGG